MFEPDRSHASTQVRPNLVVAAKSSADIWNDLADASDEVAYCAAWLKMQCARVPGTKAGLLMLKREPDGELVVAATWPERLGGPTELVQLGERALAENRTIVVSAARLRGSASIPQVSLFVSVPLGAGSEPLGAMTLALGAPENGAMMTPDAAAELLRWGGGWLSALPWMRRAHAASAGAGPIDFCLDLLEIAGQQTKLDGMAMAIVNELATRLACSRVSLGLTSRDGRIHLRAISHSATFKGESRLVDAIENAMEEAIDQHASVLYPQPDGRESRVTVAHRMLAEHIRIQGIQLYSLVLADGMDAPVGVIILERQNGEPFDPGTQQMAEAAAAMLGPVVALHARTDRLIAGRIVDRPAEFLSRLLGRGHVALKLGVLTVLLLIVAAISVEGDHQIVAASIVEPKLQRAIVAPFDGFLRSAEVRAGDTVKSGDLIATLDDRDLVLEKLKWASEREKLLQKQTEALAKHERTNIVVLGSQVRQAEAQASLAEEKLSRVRLVAPFDGLVVSGDLSQQIGAPVEKGKTLFEIAPLDAYRLIVNVDERDVRFLAPEQGGTIALAGIPGEPLRLAVSRIVPVTVAEEGRNAFRVEASLQQVDPRVRPGMEGIARITVGRRNLLWIWTHQISDTLRIMLWKHLP
jgi:multidrug resistance efflux pump